MALKNKDNQTNILRMALIYRGNFSKNNYILDWKNVEREEKRENMESETTTKKYIFFLVIPLFQSKTVEANKNHPAKRKKNL